MLRTAKPKARLAVLALDHDCVEWLSDDGSDNRRYASAPVQGTGTKAFVDAALAAVQASGSAPGPCVLALGPAQVRFKLFALPALKKSEIRIVLQRKAAQLLECDLDDALFCGAGFDGSTADDAADAAKGPAGVKAEQHWLVAAARRATLRSLRLDLRRAGFRVRRVASTQLSGLARAQIVRADTEPACIVLLVMRHSIAVTLIQGESIVNQSSLEGDLRTTPALAMTVIQEVKSFDAAWRKANRGGAVSQVVLIGLPADRGSLFKTALQTSLPAAKVILPSENALLSQDPTHDSGRLELLDACLEEGSFQLDFTVAIALRKSTLCAVVGAITVIAAAMGTVSYRHVRAQEVSELEEIARLNAQCVDLETLSAANQLAAQDLARLDALTARNAEVLSQGWPLSAILAGTLDAFGTDAALLSINVGAFDGPGEVEISAVTSKNPLQAMEHVEQVVRRLEDGPHFTRVVASPGGSLTDGQKPLPFLVRARAEAQP